MSDSSIMSISDMIDSAFGDDDANTVNHKLIQAILYILARQLRVLDRRVKVDLAPYLERSTSTLSITEVKIHSVQKKKGKSTKAGGSHISTSTASGEREDEGRRKIKRAAGAGKEGLGGKVTSMRVAIEVQDGGARGWPGGTSGKHKSDQTASGKATDRAVIDETVSDKNSRGYKTSGTKSSQPTEKSKSSDKTKSSTAKSTSNKYGSTRGGPPEMTLLEEFELNRERELRIIQKRADSREGPEKTPSPMASLDSVEATYEKLLVVERIPAEEAKKRAAEASKGRTGVITTARVSIVTQEQFASLVKSVKELKQKFEPIGKPEFPENAKLMEELRRGASLTDAMAALQLSARLEATEKALQRMTTLLTDLATQTPGINLEMLEADGMEVLYGASDVASQRSKAGPDGSRKAAYKQKTGLNSKTGTAATTPKYSSEESLGVKSTDLRSVRSGGTKLTDTQSTGNAAGEDADGEDDEKQKNYVTHEELNQGLQKIYSEIMGALGGVTTKSTVTADTVLKAVNKLEVKLNSSMNLGNRMVQLEVLTAQYAEKINSLDTGLSSQMTNYQEELTQMQHDLEVGLETMAEVLANTGGDTVVVGELNLHFSNLQGDIDHTMFIQKELKDVQKNFALDLEGMLRQIEILRELKADRDEVADALRDKADLGALNGIVSMEQFDAVRGDFEKQIGAAYDKFNNQESVWQKAIEDHLRELNEKADRIQVVSLRDDINKYLVDFRAQLKFMSDIVGEPKAFATAKKMFRDAACLSCSTPAHMELEEPNKVPALPGVRPPAIGAEAPKQKKECYPGLPIPHPIDPRAHTCTRWCGGSHTTVPNANKASTDMNIDQLPRKPTATLGTDGKIYKTDEPQKPCTACKLAKTNPQTSKSETTSGHVPNQGGDSESSFALTPLDFVSQSMPDESASVTPPPPPPLHD